MGKDKVEAEKPKAPKKRQIILETDGNSVEIVKAEIAGNFEFIGILEGIINQLKK